MINHLLSFFKEIQLETTSGDLTGSLEVVLFEGRYMLNTHDATYSFEDKYSSYRFALESIRKEIKEINSVLVLGLGLGSIPYMLQKNNGYSGEIVCVELDKEIIRLANKYYPSKENLLKLNIQQADAKTWISENKNKFDLITVDLFIGKDVPEIFHQMEFLTDLHERLSDKGILLFSRLKENVKSESELNKNLKIVFAGGNEIDTGGNLIFCYKKQQH